MRDTKLDDAIKLAFAQACRLIAAHERGELRIPVNLWLKSPQWIDNRAIARTKSEEARASMHIAPRPVRVSIWLRSPL